jgi:hypothetical protein
MTTSKPTKRAEKSKRAPRIPDAPKSILKGNSLKDLLGPEAVACLAENIAGVSPSFDADGFRRDALTGLGPLGILDRGLKVGAGFAPTLAAALRPRRSGFCWIP